ncbi:hypothetical protein N1F89_09660 [Aquibium sp. A9E412]|uniref:hypothetical protein n=1 Tax=Aquibium sp. A9E412 TaxID=2976767 RepID=UPI0025B1D691|nr:hypothetical protein [Aquibium sp. A9E412]MDN2566489.1 hypothetical protein [Aquibium sp. A9E412]
MLSDLSTSWFLMAVATVAMLSYMFALGLDAIMRRDGFGAFGNAAVITVGFFVTISAVNAYGVRFDDMMEAMLAGLGGAFLSFTVLALLKAAVDRM